MGARRLGRTPLHRRRGATAETRIGVLRICFGGSFRAIPAGQMTKLRRTIDGEPQDALVVTGAPHRPKPADTDEALLAAIRCGPRRSEWMGKGRRKVRALLGVRDCIRDGVGADRPRPRLPDYRRGLPQRRMADRQERPPQPAHRVQYSRWGRGIFAAVMGCPILPNRFSTGPARLLCRPCRWHGRCSAHRQAQKYLQPCHRGAWRALRMRCEETCAPWRAGTTITARDARTLATG